MERKRRDRELENRALRLHIGKASWRQLLQSLLKPEMQSYLKEGTYVKCIPNPKKSEVYKDFGIFEEHQRCCWGQSKTKRPRGQRQSARGPLLPPSWIQWDSPVQF